MTKEIEDKIKKLVIEKDNIEKNKEGLSQLDQMECNVKIHIIQDKIKELHKKLLK